MASDVIGNCDITVEIEDGSLAVMVDGDRSEDLFELLDAFTLTAADRDAEQIRAFAVKLESAAAQLRAAVAK